MKMILNSDVYSRKICKMHLTSILANSKIGETNLRSRATAVYKTGWCYMTFAIPLLSNTLLSAKRYRRFAVLCPLKTKTHILRWGCSKPPGLVLATSMKSTRHTGVIRLDNPNGARGDQRLYRDRKVHIN
jgi:hypothetical protein